MFFYVYYGMEKVLEDLSDNKEKSNLFINAKGKINTKYSHSNLMNSRENWKCRSNYHAILDKGHF